MLNSIKLLTNAATVNIFDIVDIRYIYAGCAPVRFDIGLCQENGERYIPQGTVISVWVEFLRADTVAQVPQPQTVIKNLSQTFIEDASIYGCDLIAADVANITTGGFRVTITEDAVITKIYSKMSIRKVASSDWPLLIEPTSSLVPTAPVDSLWERILTTLYPIYINDNVNIGSGNFITTGLVDGRDVSVDGATLDLHLNSGASKHDASEIDVEGIYGNIPGTPTDLETTIAAINTVIGNENLWDKLGTVLTPHTLGDSIEGVGSVIPNAHNSADLGTDLLRYKDIYYAGILYGGASPMKMESKEASGGTAYHLDTKNNFVAGDLLSLENVTVPKVVVDFNGNFTTVGTIDGVDVSTLPGAIAAKLDSADFTSANVTAKVLGAGYLASAGVVAVGDTLEVAFEKLDGNVAATVLVANAALPSADFTSANVTAKVLGAGYLADAGVVTIGDTLEVALEKLDGNVAGTVIVANAALPKAGGQITGSITCAGAETFDGVDVSGIPGTVSAKVAKAGDTMTGDLIMDNQKGIQFREADAGGDNYIGLKAPAALVGDVTFVLPAVDGGAGEFLKTDGSANLSFGAVVIPAQYWTKTLGVLSPATITDDVDLLTGNVLKVDTIDESTTNVGTTIETVLLKDGQIHSDYITNEYTVDPGREIACMSTNEGVLMLSANYTYDDAETLANDLKLVMNAHAANGVGIEHKHGGVASPDIANFPITAPNANSFDSLRVLTDAITIAYSLHNADGILATPVFHNLQTPNYAPSFSMPVDTLYDCALMLNEIKYRYNLHEADALGHTVISTHTEINSDVPVYGFKSDLTGTWMNFMGEFFSPEHDSVAQLGYYANAWQALWLNNLGVDGGAIHFKGNFAGSSYLKATNTGLTLDVGGNFTKFEPFTTSVLSLGDATHAFKDINLDNLAVDGGAIYFDAGVTEFLKATADGTVLNVGGFTFFQPDTDVTMRLGDVSHNFAALYLDYDGIDGGSVFFNNGGSFLKSSADGLILSSSKFTSILPRLDMALDLASNIKSFYNSHIADAVPPGTDLHTNADGANIITSNSGYDLTSLIAFITEALLDYAAHDLDATLGAGSAYHLNSAYAGNPLASVVAPINLEECVIKINDLRVKYMAHDLSAVAHNTGGRYQVVSPAALFGEVSLGSLAQPYKEFVGTKITLDGGAVDGGSLYFNSATTSFLKSSIDGLTLSIGGFTKVEPAITNTTDLGEDTLRYKDIYYCGILYGGASPMNMESKEASGGTAYHLDTKNSFVAGNLLSLENASVPKLVIDFDGNLTTVGTVDGVDVSGIPGTVSAKVAKAGDTMTGDLVMDNQKGIQFREADAGGDNYIGLKAPAVLGGDVTFVLPATDGGVGEYLKTDGSGNLSWGAGGGAAVWTKTGTVLTPTTAGDIARADQFQSKYSPVYNVLAWGLVGDGATDNTAAWQTLGAYAVTHVPCIIYFPAGDYHFDTGTYAFANQKGISIIGEGRDLTILDFSASAVHGLYSLGGAGNYFDFHVKTQTNKYALYIGTGVAYDISLTYNCWAEIRNVRASQGQINISIQNVNASNIIAYQTGAGYVGTGIYITGYNSNFKQCWAQGYQYGIRMEGTRSTFDDMKATSCTTDLYLNATFCIFSNLYGQFGGGMYTAGSGNILRHSLFYDGAFTGSGLTPFARLEDVDIGGVGFYSACNNFKALTLSDGTTTINTAQVVKRTDASLAMAIATANEIRTDLISHLGNATRHITGVQSSAGMVAATTLATLKTLVGAELTMYAAHNADAILGIGWAYHNTPGSPAHTLTSDVAPVSLAECFTKLRDLKIKYNAHELETNGHNGTGTIGADQVSTDLQFYRTLPTDYIVAIYDTSAPVSIELATVDMVAGRVIIVKDCSGAASVNNITVSTQGAEKIDFVDTVVISVNSGAVKVCGDTTMWDTSL